jgi:hypothetical protein
MADKSGVISGIFIGIAVTVGSTIATGWITRLADGSLYKVAGGKIQISPESREAVAQTGQPASMNGVPLGKHDFCMLSKVIIQSKSGFVTCAVSQNGESWTVNADRKNDETGSQAECYATCIDIK